jgi:hypothetical protein
LKKRPDEQLSGELSAFVRLYARRAQRGAEPNDRRYDRKLEKQMKRLRPEQLSNLLNPDEVEDEPSPPSEEQ